MSKQRHALVVGVLVDYCYLEILTTFLKGLVRLYLIVVNFRSALIVAVYRTGLMITRG